MSGSGCGFFSSSVPTTRGKMAKTRPWLLCGLVLVGLAVVALLVCLRIVVFVDSGCSSGGFRRAAVSADSLRCSEIGRDMLEQGGSAVDGAIAALLCTSVVNPQSMGIGGGSIVTVRNRTGNVKVYNFRETVPRAFKADLLQDCPASFRLSPGSQWIGVPGELRGYEALHRAHGKLPWAKLFEPTIQLARSGFRMPAYLGAMLESPLVKSHVQNSSLCQVFCNKQRTVLGKGDELRFPALAKTMETIAEQGADAFYTGKIGQDLIQDIKAGGGTLTAEDLKSFRVRVDDAWTVPIGTGLMHLPPPPAGGALLAFIVLLMKEFSLSPKSLEGDQKIQMYHRFIETLKFANAQKKSISDPVFNTKKSALHLLDASFISRVKEAISDGVRDRSHYGRVRPTSDRMGTTHVSVLDEDGLAVSATSTINELFGGATFSPRTGVILNNELTDFCGRADAVTAGEQPPSSMTPVVLESESGGVLVIGGSGGSMIVPSVALALINHLLLGMNLEEAIAAPIVFVDARNDVNFESGFDKSVIEGLKALGHKVGNWKYFLNVVNAVEKENGCILAVSDQRKMGTAAGY
ncbi:glutathione hydrolase 5 proenzyme isoform X2 [Betta splendens]|uniref:Glutathione hydrolase n=1 Tax=Betta splendens TaxID=158456 RepID=A0A6P7NXW5_BETSP|nr:glutathione hydrolase 5 proenzyme isoform X2 [Betta splendens]